MNSDGARIHRLPMPAIVLGVSGAIPLLAGVSVATPPDGGCRWRVRLTAAVVALLLLLSVAGPFD